MEVYNEEIKALEEDYGIEVPKPDKFDFYDIHEFLDFTSELDDYGLLRTPELIEGVVDNETVDIMAKDELNNSGWERVKCFLEDASLTVDYHYIGGDGNVEYLSSEIIGRMIEDLLEDISDYLI